MRELRSICESREIVPTSCIVSASTLIVDDLPFAVGGFGDVHQGILGDLRVCVARVRLYRGYTRAKNVRFFHHYPLSRCLINKPYRPAAKWLQCGNT